MSNPALNKAFGTPVAESAAQNQKYYGEQPYAQQYGMPISTMAAFGVADFLLKHENAAKAVKMATLAVARESVPSVDLLERLTPDLIAQVTKAFSQPNLPLDGEATVEGV